MAKLKITIEEGTSKAGNAYKYVKLVVLGLDLNGKIVDLELPRLFLSNLEMLALETALNNK